MKSGNLNFLEPSGPLQTCNGSDLALYYPIYLKFVEIYLHTILLNTVSLMKIYTGDGILFFLDGNDIIFTSLWYFEREERLGKICAFRRGVNYV